MSENPKVAQLHRGQTLARPRILIVGCGDVGLRVAALLRGRFALAAVTRRAEQVGALRDVGIRPILADLDDPSSLWRLKDAAPYVVHLAPPPQEGSKDTRTRHLLAALGRTRRMVYVSTSGVYGDCGGAQIDETRTPRPETARAVRRLDAERTLRQWAKRNHTRLCILRVPGIYAADRLPLARLRAGTPALRAEDDVHTNHIHADDLARIVVAALWRGMPQRIYHASDDSDLLMGDYFDLVARQFELPLPARVSRAELREVASPASYSFMRESRRLSNLRLKQELSVDLLYARVADGLRAVRPIVPAPG